MKKDMTELKKVIAGMLEDRDHEPTKEQSRALTVKDYDDRTLGDLHKVHDVEITSPEDIPENSTFDTSEIIEESLSLQDKENEMIKKALEKHRGKRKSAAKELGISERTLYRKIKFRRIRSRIKTTEKNRNHQQKSIK